jgi:hypothetical protein
VFVFFKKAGLAKNTSMVMVTTTSLLYSFAYPNHNIAATRIINAVTRKHRPEMFTPSTKGLRLTLNYQSHNSLCQLIPDATCAYPDYIYLYITFK